MDPNEARRMLAGAMAGLADEIDGVPLSPVEHADAVERAVDAWLALDGWLSKGGFPPEAWRPS